MILPKKKDGPQLVAELSVFSAADGLQWARSSRLTGRLSFRTDAARITLLFDDGGLIYAASRDRRAAFGRHLFSEGLVDEVDLAAAMVYGRDNQQRIGAVMVELGILDEAIVRRELHRHTLNLASIPISWTDGWLSAEKSETEAMQVLMPEPVDPTYLLMESARRVDELRAIRERLPHDDVLLAPGDSEPPANASARTRRTLEELTSGITMGELFERIGGSDFLFLENLNELVELGAVKADESLVGTTSLSQTG